jgi:preprotein translocase subunit SecD
MAKIVKEFLMGKIKSAVITAVLCAAIVVLALFATISCPVPGSKGVKRYNSFISSIQLGSDLTGSAYTILYPDGVISAEDYKFGIPEDADDKKEYEDKYTQFGSVYVENDVLEEEQDLASKVQSDAKILSARFSKKGYSSYSVSVQDDYTIKISVPTGFTYAAYKGYDTTTRSEQTSAISQTMQVLSYSGELSLRNTEVGNSNRHDILTPVNADVASYFKSFSSYSAGGSYAVKVNLSKTGKTQFASISSTVSGASDDTSVRFYVGENQLLALTVSEEIDSSSFYISVSDTATASDYAIVLNSAAHSQVLSLDYDVDDLTIVYASAPLGDNAAIWMFAAIMLILVAIVIYSIVRYKSLGLVNTIIAVLYTLTIIVATMLIGIEVTVAGAFTAVLGLILLTGVNFAQFESIRRETKKGKTMQAAIKSGYKAMLATILDMHIVLLVVSIIVTLVCKGELAACGFIFFIAVIASYVLYWFTRLMWYVISSPVKNKFAFGGFKREVIDND